MIKGGFDQREFHRATSMAGRHTLATVVAVDLTSQVVGLLLGPWAPRPGLGLGWGEAINWGLAINPALAAATLSGILGEGAGAGVEG